MNKNDLIVSVSKKTDTSQKVVSDIISTAIDTIKETLSAGEEVKLTGFINFEIKDVPEREARNVRTGEPVTVPAHKTIKAKLAKSVKDCLK